MPDVIPDPGEFARLKYRKGNVHADIPYLENENHRIECTNPVLIACWAAAAWSAKARALPPESKNQAEWQTYDDNAALCLRLAAKGEIK